MAVSLDDLLYYAGLGMHVFPLCSGSKKPLPGSRGLDDATTDPDKIRAWYSPSLNWGLNCGRSGLLVVDLDVKGEFDGLEAWRLLAADRGAPPTRSASTPSGGSHLYFRGEGRSSASSIAPGIDTRGAGGYVVLPGSVVGDAAYTWTCMLEPAPIPDWLSGMLAPRSKELSTAQADTLDAPLAIARVSEYLKHADPAIEGCGGDAKTYQVALRCKDLGVSEPTCLELMAAIYSPRCIPVWEPDELERKVANAYAYGTKAAGSDAGCPFSPTEGQDLLFPEAAKRRPMVATRASAFVDDMPPRPWLLGVDYILGFITGTISQGGAGKSMLTMLEAMAVVTGRDLTGAAPKMRAPAWIYNTEDPSDELGRRVLAAAAAHDIPLADLDDLHISSGRTSPLILAQSTRGVIQVNEDRVDEVVAYIQEHGIKLWVLDPFVHTHHCDENSNAEIAHVMLVLSGIAEKTGCAISLVHHRTKGTGREGDMDVARGASAFGGAVRIMRTLNTMSEADAETFGIQADRRRWYVRLDDAKANMAPPADRARWFEKVDHQLRNGDHVGTVKAVELSRVERSRFLDAGDAVRDAVEAGKLQAGSMSVAEAAIALKAMDAVERFKGWKLSRIEKQVVEAFSGAQVYVGSMLQATVVDGVFTVSASGDWLA